MSKVLLPLIGVLLLNVAACAQPAERYVRNVPRPPMYFAMNPGTGRAPLEVEFTNLSQDGRAFLWDFGDGTTSTERGPSHIYAQPGVYAVQLTVFKGEDENPRPVTSTQTLVVYRGFLTKVTIEPSEITLAPTETEGFTARALDQFGNEIPDVAFTWRISGGGFINPSGVVMAGFKAGSFPDAVEVQAILGDTTQSATATLNVEPGPLSRIVVEPRLAELDVGGSHAFAARALDWFGNEIKGASFEWSVPAVVGEFDDSGVFTAGTLAGSFTGELRATHGEVYRSASMNLVICPGPLDRVTIAPEAVVVEAGGVHQFTPIALDRYGNEVTDVSFVWTLSGPIGVIDAKGTLKVSSRAGQDGGAVHVKAVQGDTRRGADATVTVAPGPLTRISVVPKSDVLVIGDKTQLWANPVDQYGNPIGGLSVSFSLPVDAGDSVVHPSGLFVAGTRAGTHDVVITAVQGDVTKTTLSTVRVLPGPLNHVRLSPPEMTLAPAEQRDFKVKALDRHGNEIPDVEVAWAVVNQGGTIDQDGLFAAGADSGTFFDTVEVIVTHNGVSKQGSATVIVESGSLAKATDASDNY